jgi:hypothetical protein
MDALSYIVAFLALLAFGWFIYTRVKGLYLFTGKPKAPYVQKGGYFDGGGTRDPGTRVK